SIVSVLAWRLGLQTFLVWRWLKLTLLPYCLPFLSNSSRCIIKVLFYRFIPIKSTRVSRIYLRGMSDTATSVIILLPVLLLSMAIHEMMHAFASNYLGDDTAR